MVVLRKKRRNLEGLEQQLFFRWLEVNYPSIRQVCFSIPNGGSRTMLEAVNLKRQGVTAGVPDVFLAMPSGAYHGLFIEFKHGKNKLTGKQANMCSELLKNGYCVKVCYSFEEARKVVSEYYEERD